MTKHETYWIAVTALCTSDLLVKSLPLLSFVSLAVLRSHPGMVLGYKQVTKAHRAGADRDNPLSAARVQGQNIIVNSGHTEYVTGPQP